MELRDALSQIHEIRDRMERSQLYRGYRAAPVAASAVLALAGALGQDAVLGSGGGVAHPHGFAAYWGGIAVLGCVILGIWLVFYCRRADPRQRTRRTVAALEELLPSFLAGALVSFAVVGIAPQLLPGLWQVFFGLGLFASRRCLPSAVAWIAAAYVLSGTLFCGLLPGFSPWAMGIPFGVGQLGTAVVLYRALERDDG